jgi:hypothetical protein
VCPGRRRSGRAEEEVRGGRNAATTRIPVIKLRGEVEARIKLFVGVWAVGRG